MLDMYLLSYIFIPYLIFLILLCQKDFQYRSSTVCTASALCLRRPRVAFLISRVYILTIIVKIQYLFIPAWEHLKILSTARTTIILCWVEIIKLYVGRKNFPPRYSHKTKTYELLISMQKYYGSQTSGANKIVRASMDIRSAGETTD